MSEFLTSIENEICYVKSQIHDRKKEIERCQAELAAYNNVKGMYAMYIQDKVEEANLDEEIGEA